MKLAVVRNCALQNLSKPTRCMNYNWTTEYSVIVIVSETPPPPNHQLVSSLFGKQAAEKIILGAERG